MDFNTVSNLKLDVDSNLHAGGVSQLQNFYNTIEKGRLSFISKVRPEELIRKSYIEDALFPHVNRYASPKDLKYKDIIDLKLLDKYRNVDSMEQPATMVYSRRFKQFRGHNVISVGYENGIKYVSVNHPRGIHHERREKIHNCDSLTDNGTWNVGGNVVNLRVDELNHVQGKASLKFDINNSSTTGFLENFTLESFDLEHFLQKGAVFSWLSVPLPRELISVKLSMGSDSSDLTTDYYHSAVNQPHDSNEFTTGWNLLKYMLNSISSVGTPNPKALTWVRLEFTTTGSPIDNCNLDQIISRTGAVYEVTYNSSYILQDALTKAWKKRATSDSDIIVAEEDSYRCLMLEVTLAAQEEIYGNSIGAKSDVMDVKQKLDEAYQSFLMEHKSEAILEMDSQHVFGNYLDGYSDNPMPGFGDRWGAVNDDF